jgi:hypothetical protein
LAVRKPQIDHSFELIVLLDSLRYDPDVFIVRKVEEVRDETLGSYIYAEAANELDVELDEIGRQSRNPIDARVSGAEVVQRNAEASLFELGHHLAHSLEIADVRGFRDLEDDSLRYGLELLDER